MLHHGGLLTKAAVECGIETHDWIDISTGISPFHYHLSEIPKKSWLRLPENEDGLYEAAIKYYHTQHLTAIAGEQQAIQLLPIVRAEKSRVAVVSPTYNEHAYHWRMHGHYVEEILPSDIQRASLNSNVMVIGNPNNPTGVHYYPEFLMEVAYNLETRGGWLIVDEAFIDTNPQWSMTRHLNSSSGLIVLRSFGKFFGLPGIRLGFLFASKRLIEVLEAFIGPWPINGPGRYIATKALADKLWQNQAATSLKKASRSMSDCLKSNGITVDGSTDFFHWCKYEKAKQLHEYLKTKAILTRYFSDSNSLRFGLPESQSKLQMVSSALNEFRL